MHHRTRASTLLLSAALCACSGEETPTTTPPAESAAEAAPIVEVVLGEAGGTVTHDGHTFQVESAVAVWEPDKPGLTLSFRPFVPSASEVERIRKGHMYQVAMEHERGGQGFEDRLR